MTNTEATANKIFISYSHKDIKWLQKLTTMMQPMARENIIDSWDDTRIQTGDKWREQIHKAIENAKIAILIVSPNFLASDFINKDELPPLLQSANNKNLTIFWLCVSACLYDETEIQNYQAAHEVSKPLDILKSSQVNKVLSQVCRDIKKKIGQNSLNP